MANRLKISQDKDDYIPHNSSVSEFGILRKLIFKRFLIIFYPPSLAEKGPLLTNEKTPGPKIHMRTSQ